MEFDIPSLRFDNRTSFDALHFDTIDQNKVAFHVIVAKTGYALGPCDADGLSALNALEAPALLYVEDRHYDDEVNASVRYESDLAPYKPACDVIVIGDAYAPGGQASRSFQVRLQVRRPDRDAALPERPQALNPFQHLSPAAHAAWQAELEQARASTLPGDILLDKTLNVSGERVLRRLPLPLRMLLSSLKLCTFGLADPNPWRLSAPQPMHALPLRYELAQGGQCRIDASDKAANKVSREHRLTPAQVAQHPDGAAAPAAHQVLDSNPLGRGFACRWYLNATRIGQLPAPRIDSPDNAFNATRFWQAANGSAPLTPAGFGFIGRGWTPRRTLIGSIENKRVWADDDVPALPNDFDFGYWNGAPADQQCAHLSGEERFTLVNLCPADAPFARADAQGNTVLRFALPRQSLFVLAAGDDGQLAVLPLSIDTVVLEPTTGRVDLVWRLCMLADGELSDARLMHADKADALQRLKQWNAPPQATAQSPSDRPSVSSS